MYLVTRVRVGVNRVCVFKYMHKIGPAFIVYTLTTTTNFRIEVWKKYTHTYTSVVEIWPHLHKCVRNSPTISRAYLCIREEFFYRSLHTSSLACRGCHYATKQTHWTVGSIYLNGGRLEVYDHMNSIVTNGICNSPFLH